MDLGPLSAIANEITGSSGAAAILAVNPGSASLKAAVHDSDGRRLMTLKVDRPPTDADAAVADIAAELEQRDIDLIGVAHRVVHGGPRHDMPTMIDDTLLDDLRAVIPMAPLHLPGDIAGIIAARRRWPGLPHVACFDTTFHRSLPPEARRLPLPDDVVALGVQRYGFHGLSVQHVVDVVPDLGLGVVAHLGGGCSITAVHQGQSVRTSMSFTPTGGVPSAGRAGDLDPEIVLFLLDKGYSVADIRDLLDHRSGLAGMANSAADVATVQDAAEQGDDAARKAIAVFTADIGSTIAGYASALGGLDTLVFTGGVGEHSPGIRSGVTDRLVHLGVCTDPIAVAPGNITARGAAVRTLVVTADEEIVMDRQARALLDA
jgi:acetate kinase